MILLFFESPSNFVAACFFSLRKLTVNCTSVLLILLLLHSTFFKGKQKSGILFLVVFVGF